ncbi:MAG: hypothetical protein MUE78_09875, partial [Ilumatobacteraceae bacterium]|nr:hypothetical protein [Ilumatobacteraceae bacterium]
DAAERFERVDLAVRAAAPTLVDVGALVLAVRASADGSIELVTNRPVDPPAPWSRDGDRWHLAGSVPVEALTAVSRSVGTPCPLLVQLGVASDGADIFVDLESMGLLGIDGPSAATTAVLEAIGATIATSVLAESAWLITVGGGQPVAATHPRHHRADSLAGALDHAASLLGARPGGAQTAFELRVRHTGGEAWEPVVVLAGGEESVDPAAVCPGAGLAVVVLGPASTAVTLRHRDVDRWLLEPLGIEMRPVGLEAAESDALAALLAEPSSPLEAVDVTMRPACREPVGSWSLMVRLFGGVDVVDTVGDAVGFERSKPRELLAWLVTHRERSTRTAARTALWDLDVRDATFSNVVSEARRAMARQVEPPAGAEWLGRTLTEELPLHAAVVSDAEVLEAALDRCRGGSVNEVIETLQPVIGLLRGMPFEGTSYLWPDAEGITSNLVLLGTGVAARLAGAYLAIGDVDGVFESTARGLAVLPGHEELIALRMRAHATAGDRAGVRHEWERYERSIVADPWSDGEPAPKLVQLRQELLSSST